VVFLTREPGLFTYLTVAVICFLLVALIYTMVAVAICFALGLSEETVNVVGGIVFVVSFIGVVIKTLADVSKR
jgi:hypothetical protein